MLKAVLIVAVEKVRFSRTLVNTEEGIASFGYSSEISGASHASIVYSLDISYGFDEMLSRSLKRALLDSRWPTPPTFLLPWTASLTTVSHTTNGNDIPPPVQPISRSRTPQDRQSSRPKALSPSSTDDQAALPTPGSTSLSAESLSDSVRELLPHLQAQSPHYISAHLYDRPYILTQGDTLRLPFLMKGVEPGDVLRLNCATFIGSRDYTLKAAASAPRLKSTTRSTVPVKDDTTGSLSSISRVMPTSDVAASDSRTYAPHFIPHIAKGKTSYLDERLFVCRAVVMGWESDPMEVIEKTKRRNRKVKHVKSKQRHTILKIKELRVRSLEEVDSGELD
nr:homocitrate dehydratase, mitochondrial [Quercus suber]